MSYLLIKTRTRKNKKKAEKKYSDVFEVESFRKKVRGGYSSPKQRVLGWVGVLRRFPLIEKPKEIDISLLKELDYSNILRSVFQIQLENHGFTKLGNSFINKDVIVDLENFNVFESESKKLVAIPINAGFISTKTMQDLVNIRMHDLDDDELYKKNTEDWRKKANLVGLYDTVNIDESSKLNKKDIYSIRKELSKKLSEKKITGQLQLCQFIMHQHPDYKKFQSKIDTKTGMEKESLEDFYKKMGVSAPKKWSPRGIGK